MNIKFITLFFGFIIPVISFAQSKDIEYFLSNGINNSPLLYELRNNILTAGIDSALIVAANRYQLSGNGNAYYAPIIKGYGYDNAITNGQQLSAIIALNKQIYNKRNLSLQFADLQIQKDSIKITSAISTKDIRKIIIGQYITVYSDQLQIDFNKELSGLLNRQESILKKLTQKNVYNQVDYLSFLITVQQNSLTGNQLEVQYKNDFATLNYVAGIFDTTYLKLAEPDLQVINSFITDSSAFFLKYKLDSLRLRNTVALIDLGYKPKVSLFADAGYQSSFEINPYKNFGTSVGINFSIPIYDGKQKKLQYQKVSILERTRQRNRDFFQNQYYQQIAQLQQQISAIETLREPINKQIKFLETLIEANGKLLETGGIKITDYILALNNYITAKNLLVQNMISRYQVINQLNYWNK
ncbi:MAG: TolC family protein [Ginsengibacter sp.]